MKVILRGYGTNMTQQQRFAARAQAADFTRTRATSKKPSPPQDIIVQSSPRGLLVSWGLPSGFNADISGWRVYKDTESNLFQKIADRGTRQSFIEASAGSTPPVTNVFISSINTLGYESAKIQAQGQAVVEAGAPALPPSTQPTGTSGGGYSGGYIGTRFQFKGA